MAEESTYLEKALESLAGAESELNALRYNNCANRAYYACFQAAIAALYRAGIRPGSSGQWSHAFVPSQFDGLLINRRKLYPAELRSVLAQTYALRQKADYQRDSVTQAEASRIRRRAQLFVETVQGLGG